MRTSLRALGFLVALTACSATAQQRPAATTSRAAPAPTTAQRFENAWYAWDAGAYDSALVELQRVLRAPDAAAFHDRVAELTGEIWKTVEVAKDARAPLWSPDGRFLAYETGAPNVRRVTVVRAAPGFEVVAQGAGATPTFAPDGRSVAWVRTAGARPVIVWTPLDGGAPREVAVDAPAAVNLTLFGRAPMRAAIITGTPRDTSARLLVRDLTVADGTWRQVALAGAQPAGLVRSPDGSRVVVLLGPRGALARVRPDTTPSSTPATLTAATAPFTAADTATPMRFAELVDGALGAAMTGLSPTFSRDGRTLAWLEPNGGTTRLRTMRGSGPQPATAVETPFAVQAFTLSPNGSTIAFTQMLREDWELFTAPADGSAAPTRVSREIQHNVSPQFLNEHQILDALGETRHRRSHINDLRTGTRTRLFHNNSVRTVAPEYEWAPSPDGTRVAIVSERDGDTVTPHRHLYLMDLNVKVSHAELVARVDSNLAAERTLRENGRRMFAPIERQVRAAVDQVSTARIYENERSLFAFDSKHILQPGNWPATEWLAERYRSYGLQTHLQRFTTRAEGRDLNVANVIAVVPGTVDPELIYVVGAHFDSRVEGPGADDNTSGTVMILEAARIIAQNPLPATVMFVGFTGEEGGLRGAREFARRMKDSIHVVGALNNDMMGWSNDHRIDNTIRYSNPGLRDVQHAAAIQFSRLITYDAFYFKSTDAHALYDAWGDIIAGIGSYPILGNPHYHKVHDVLETINHEQLAQTSRTTIATIMLMASSPSRLTGLIAQGKIATWDAAPERGVTRYLVRYGPAEDPMRHAMTVTSPRATLSDAQPGWVVSVKAVNGAGLEGWDWARAAIR